MDDVEKYSVASAMHMNNVCSKNTSTRVSGSPWNTLKTGWFLTIPSLLFVKENKLAEKKEAGRLGFLTFRLRY